MSTRGQTFWYDGDSVIGDHSAALAGVFKHWDGYPSNMLPLIRKAFVASDRKDDIGDVAAWFVAQNKDGDGDVYIDGQPHGDLSFEYHIWFDATNGPMVTMFRHGESIWTGNLFRKVNEQDCPKCKGTGKIRGSEIDYSLDQNGRGDAVS